MFEEEKQSTEAVKNRTKDNWEEINIKSWYLNLLEIQKQLDAGNIENAKIGLQVMTDSVAGDEKSDARRFLKKLMEIILLWKHDERYRIGKNSNKIWNLRDEINYLKEIYPFLITDEFLKSCWDKAYEQALRSAQIVFRKIKPDKKLSWEDVFETKYQTEYEVSVGGLD